MKVLVIGSEGNIGAPFIRYMKEQGHEVFSSDIRPGHREDYVMADINHPLDLMPAFDWGPDVVYLMAAMVSRVTCEQAGSLAVATNLAGLNNVIQLTKRAGAKLVFISTSEVYGPQDDDAVMSEDHTICNPNNRYGLTKLLGEALVQYEVKNNGLDAVIIRPFMIYDENETAGNHRSAMVRFAWNLSHGRPVEVHKFTKRSWMHVSDACVALGRAANVKGLDCINIGHPYSIWTENLAMMICDNLGADKSLIHYANQPSKMTKNKLPLLVKQREILGVIPVVSVEDGIRRVCARFKK